MLKKLGIALLAVLAIGQAHSADWKLIDKSSGHEFKLYFDQSSVTTVNGLTGKTYEQAWFKNEIIHDLNVEDGLVVGDYMLNLWHIDCEARKLVGIKSVRYKQNGEYLEEIINPVRVMRSVIPATAGELMWYHVCVAKK